MAASVKFKKNQKWGLAVDSSSIPEALRVHERWVPWIASPRPNRKHKWDKKPVSPNSMQAGPWSWSDPDNWSTLDETYAVYQKRDDVSGVGFVMNNIGEDVFGDDIIAIDLDNVVNDGDVEKAGQRIVDDFPTYWEISPSGTGLRGFVRGKIDVEVNADGVEVYDGRVSRFVTVTGAQLPGSCVEIQRADPSLLKRFIQSRKKGKSSSHSRMGEPIPPLLDDEEAADLLAELYERANCDLQEYLDTGDTIGRYDHGGSLSEVVAALIRTAYNNDFDDAQVLSMLWHHEHTQLNYKKDRPHRLAFFWSECCACRGGATADDFEAFELDELDESIKTSAKTSDNFIDTLIPGGEFASQLEDIDFVIESVIQRGYIHALTGFSNAGKTAIALAMAKAISNGDKFGEYFTEPGRVLFLAGENPQNVQMRLRGMVEQEELDQAVIDKILVKLNVFSLRRNMKDIGNTLEELDDVVLIIIDSKLVFFEGDSEDDNKQAAQQAMDLQMLTQMHGNPAVLVLSHPAKAVREQQNLEPRGGGAFLNQIDANLTAWKCGEDLTELSWAKKVRGGGFNPILMKLREVPLKDCVMKQSGKPITTVLAEPIASSEANQLKSDSRSNEDKVLLAMFESPGISIRDILRRLAWTEGQKGKVERALKALREDKLISKRRQGDPYEITKKGKAEVKEIKANGFELPALEFF